MDRIAVQPERPARPFGQICDAVNEVDSSLDAICELLHLANGARVHAGGIHALLKPLQLRLQRAADDLNNSL